MKKYIVFALACFSVFGIKAQENLNNEIIDVVKDFRPKIMQAHKIKSQPLFIDTTKVSQNLKYLIRFEEFRVSQNLDSLRARVLSRSPFEYFYSKHIELGLGTYLNPHLALDLSNGKSTKSIYQAYLNYNGAFSEEDNSQNKFSNLNFGGAYKRVFNAFVLQSNLLFKDEFRFDLDETPYRNSNIDYDAAFLFTDTISALIPKELHISSNVFFRNTKFNEYQISAATFQSGHLNKIRNWDFNNDFSFLQSNDVNTLHWKSNLSTSRNTKRVIVKVGLNTDLLVDNIKIFPEIRAQYELINKGLFTYAEVGGDRHLYSLQNVYGANPYTYESSVITEDLLPSNTKYFARVGINGSLFRGVSYQVSLEANTQDGFMHFIESTNYFAPYEPRFIPKFTTVNMVKLNAQIDAKWTDKFHVWLKGEYKSFDKYLSHVPELEVGLYGDYHYNDQWFMTSSLLYTGAREYLVDDVNLSSYKVDPMIDLNCKVNFAYNKQIGFYIEGMNLLNNSFGFLQQELLIGRRLNLGAKYRF